MSPIESRGEFMGIPITGWQLENDVTHDIDNIAEDGRSTIIQSVWTFGESVVVKYKVLTSPVLSYDTEWQRLTYSSQKKVLRREEVNSLKPVKTDKPFRTTRIRWRP